MYERLWYELGESKFHLEYLSLHINKLVKINKTVDNWLLVTTLGGIGCWYKFAEHSIFWSALLLLLTGFRLMKTRFMPSEQEISTLKSELEFYIDHVRRLETLWLNYGKGEYKVDEAEAVFEKLRDEERLMTRINKHETIERVEPINMTARKTTIQYLNKLANVRA